MRDTVADKRTAALKAALELISEQGFHGTPMSQIAQKAGVSIGTIYHYFSGKDDLLNALYIDIKSRLARYVLQNYSCEMTVRKAFKHILSGVVRYCIENPAELSFAEQYENSPLITDATRKEISHISEPMTELFRRAMEQELIKALPVPMLNTLILSAVIGLAKLYLSGPEKLEDASFEAGLDAIWDMIKR